MAKFQFRFDALEKVRKRDEEGALRSLAAAQRAHQEVLNFKQKILMKLEKFQGEERANNTDLNLGELAVEAQFIAGMKQKLLQTEHAITRSKKAVDKNMQKFVQTRKRTRMVEVIKENDLAEFKGEKRKKENKELAELYVLRASQKKELI